MCEVINLFTCSAVNPHNPTEVGGYACYFTIPMRPYFYQITSGLKLGVLAHINLLAVYCACKQEQQFVIAA
jgi:hypothetical protein